MCFKNWAYQGTRYFFASADNDIVLINDDFLKVDYVKPNSIDLIVTSPPYNVDIEYEGYRDDIPYRPVPLIWPRGFSSSCLAPYAVGLAPPPSGCHLFTAHGAGTEPAPSPALYLRERDNIKAKGLFINLLSNQLLN